MEQRADAAVSRKRAQSQSHKRYLETLKPPSSAESERISSVQQEREEATRRRYESAQESDAAKLIQRAYRGHRERRQLNGLMLTPSTRWVEIIKEWRYRSATAPHDSKHSVEARGSARTRATSDAAHLRWRRATQIAERAGAGETAPTVDAIGDDLPHRHKRLSKRKSTETSIDNSMLLDLRYFLEMIDLPKHRYGANLQIYHAEWQRSSTKQNFFEWLDRGDGRGLDLPMCRRAKMETERIRYLSKEERKDYLVRVDDEGKMRWVKNDILITTSIDHYQDSMAGIVERGTAASTFDDEEIKRKLSADLGFSSKLAAVSGFRRKSADDSSDTDSIPSDGEVTRAQTEQDIVHHTATKDKTPRKKFHVSPATILNHLLRASVKPGTWIYVADTLGRLYVGIKSSGSFQHTSFLAGARISSAGSIGIEKGQLSFLSPLSGHYRPTTKSFKAFTNSLRESGVDMSELKVSNAYAVLLGMEVYSKSKRGVDRVVHGKEGERRGKSMRRCSEKGGADETESLAPLQTDTSVSAVERVEHNWEAEHEQRRRLGRLHIHRKRLSTSTSTKGTEG